MPIFRVKSVKIHTGQKNLHWRRQPRQWQLSGMPNTTTTWHKKGVSGCSQHRVGDIFTSWLGWIHSPGLNWNTLQVDLPSPGYQCVFSSAMDHLLRPLMVFERPRLPINWTRQETWTPLDWCESSLALNSKVLTPRPCLKIGLDLPDEDLQRI